MPRRAGRAGGRGGGGAGFPVKRLGRRRPPAVHGVGARSPTCCAGSSRHALVPDDHRVGRSGKSDRDRPGAPARRRREASENRRGRTAGRSRMRSRPEKCGVPAASCARLKVCLSRYTTLALAGLPSSSSANPFPGPVRACTTEAKRTEIRDPARLAAKRRCVCDGPEGRAASRHILCRVPDLLPLTLQSSGKGGEPSRNALGRPPQSRCRVPRSACESAYLKHL